MNAIATGPQQQSMRLPVIDNIIHDVPMDRTLEHLHSNEIEYAIICVRPWSHIMFTDRNLKRIWMPSNSNTNLHTLHNKSGSLVSFFIFLVLYEREREPRKLLISLQKYYNNYPFYFHCIWFSLWLCFIITICSPHQPAVGHRRLLSCDKYCSTVPFASSAIP